MSETGLVQILEGALMAAGEPLSLQRLAQLFDEFDRPSNDELREGLDAVSQRCEGRGYELKQVASGYRFQVRQNLSTWVGRLWQERPQRYSRALLETLSLIAYRQPITRGEIEEIRGVAVSSNIIKTLQEREWVRVVGHRDVPGRPAMYATTRQFLDYFNLKSLEELPPLAEIKELDNLSGDLPLEQPADGTPATGADTDAAESSGEAQTSTAESVADNGEVEATDEASSSTAPSLTLADIVASHTVAETSPETVPENSVAVDAGDREDAGVSNFETDSDTIGAGEPTHADEASSEEQPGGQLEEQGPEGQAAEDRQV